MSKFVDKKWYSGTLELDLSPNINNEPRGEEEPTYPRCVHKCLVQKGKKHDIRINLADSNNLITVQHLCRSRVRVYGRLVDLSSSPSMSMSMSSVPTRPYYLEVEQIQVVGEEEDHNYNLPPKRDMECRGNEDRKNNVSPKSEKVIFIGRLLSLGPVLATPLAHHQGGVGGDEQEERQQQDSSTPIATGLGERSVLLEVNRLQVVDPAAVGSEHNGLEEKQKQKQERRYVMLLNEATALHPYLSVDQLYTFSCTPPAVFYVASTHNPLLQPQSQLQSQLSGLSLNMVSIYNPAAVCVHECDAAPPPPPPPPYRTLLNTDSIATLHRSILRPPSTLLRDTLMYTEMDIRGELLETFTFAPLHPAPPSQPQPQQESQQHSSSLDISTSTHPRGTPRGGTLIELAGKSHPDDTRGDKFLLYFSLHPLLAPAGLPRLLPSLRRGAVVLVRNVLPVYLWGRLHGFAATPRSQLLLETFSPLHTQPSRLPHCPDQEFGAILRKNSDLHCGGRNSLAVLKEWKCFQFTAWWAYAQRRVVQALLPASGSRSGSGDNGDNGDSGDDGAAFLSATSIFSSTLSDAIFNIPVDMLDQRLLLSEKITITDTTTTTTTTTTAPAVDDTSRPTPTSTPTDSSDSAALLRSWSWGLEATYDKESAQLYLVRAGVDADYLCSRLPEVWTSSMLRQYGENMILYYNKRKVSKKEKKCRQEAISSSSSSSSEDASVLTTSKAPQHFHCLASLVQSSSLRHETFQCPHPILLVGTVTALLSPPRMPRLPVGGGGGGSVGACDGLWCLSVTDRSGQDLLVLIPPPPSPSPSCHCQQNISSDNTTTTTTTCSANCFKTTFQHWEQRFSSPSITHRPQQLIVTLANPLVLAETHPSHNHQSAQLLVVVQSVDVWASWRDRLRDRDRPPSGKDVKEDVMHSHVGVGVGVGVCISSSSSAGTYATGDAAEGVGVGVGVASLKHSLAVGKFIATRLSKTTLTDDVPRSTFSEAVFTHQHPLLSGSGGEGEGGGGVVVISVREALMIDPLTSPGDVVVLPCIRGVVVSKEHTNDTGYYYVHNEEPNSHSHTQNMSSNGRVKKRRKVSLPKCVVHLRDTEYSDVLYLYLPATPSAAGVCVQHLELNVFNCKLKLSGSKRHLFLDYDINESHIGVAGVLSMQAIQSASTTVATASTPSGGKVSHVSNRITSTNTNTNRSMQPNEVLISNQQSNSNHAPHQTVFPRMKLPRSNTYTLYQNHYRNRCMWSLSGRFLLAKEVNIFMRCNACHAKASMLYSTTQTGNNSYQCNGRGNCGHKAVSSPSGFHVWWHGVLVFDDGSGELQVCLEGLHLLSVLRALYEEGDSKHHAVRGGDFGGERGGGGEGQRQRQSTDRDIDRDRDRDRDSCEKVSFISFQESIEKHVMSSFSLISYSFSSVAMARGYNSLQDSDHGVCSEEVLVPGRDSGSSSGSDSVGGCVGVGAPAVGSLGARRAVHGGARGINRSKRSVQSVYNDYYDTSPSNGHQQRYLEKIRYVQLIHTLLQSCSFASSTFEIYVKIIFSNNFYNNNNKNKSGVASSASTASTDGLSISLRRALGRLDSSAGSITAGGRVQSHIRKVKVQCSNVPSWIVENVELPSEAVATLKLQCLGVAQTGTGGGGGGGKGATTAERAWEMLSQLA